MNKLKYLLLTLVTGFTLVANAQTNTLVSTNSAIDNPTNLNQVILGMLVDARAVGKELYGTSKEAISKSVDFVIDEAPKVVREFLTWRFAEATIGLVIYIIVAGVLFYLAYKLNNGSKNANKEPGVIDMLSEYQWFQIFRYICILCGMIALTSGLYDKGLAMTKIKIAPRVYLIEYVIDKTQGRP